MASDKNIYKVIAKEYKMPTGDRHYMEQKVFKEIFLTMKIKKSYLCS